MTTTDLAFRSPVGEHFTDAQIQWLTATHPHITARRLAWLANELYEGSQAIYQKHPGLLPPPLQLFLTTLTELLPAMAARAPQNELWIFRRRVDSKY